MLLSGRGHLYGLKRNAIWNENILIQLFSNSSVVGVLRLPVQVEYTAWSAVTFKPSRDLLYRILDCEIIKSARSSGGNFLDLSIQIVWGFLTAEDHHHSMSHEVRNCYENRRVILVFNLPSIIFAYVAVVIFGLMLLWKRNVGGRYLQVLIFAMHCYLICSQIHFCWYYFFIFFYLISQNLFISRRHRYFPLFLSFFFFLL